MQDSKCLYDCIKKLQEIYDRKYIVDITTLLSKSTLSMKIFRSKLLKVNIPIFKKLMILSLEKANSALLLIGIKMKAEKIYYSDVNSLYPFASLKPYACLIN